MGVTCILLASHAETLPTPSRSAPCGPTPSGGSALLPGTGEGKVAVPALMVTPQRARFKAGAGR